MRIVVVTAHDSGASVILVLRAGADDYLPKPVGEGELVDALLGRSPVLPPVPETPLRIERVRWEHAEVNVAVMLEEHERVEPPPSDKL